MANQLKSRIYTAFQLNGLNGVRAVILRYFTEFGTCEANYVNVLEVRPTVYDKTVARRTRLSALYI